MIKADKQELGAALADRWTQLQSELIDAGALLVPGQLEGEGWYVAIAPDTDTFVQLISRGLSQVAYTHEQVWGAARTDAMRALADTKAAFVDEDDEDGEEDEDLFDAETAATRREGVRSAAARLRGVLAEAPLDGQVVSAQMSVVVGGVVHEQVLDSPWFGALTAAGTALDEAVAAVKDPPMIDPARRALRWEQLQAERAAQVAQHEAELARVGEALVEACVADAVFRTTRSEPDRWQRALQLVRDLLTWPELSQQDRGYLRPVARRAYEHVLGVVAPQLRDQARETLDWHAGQLRSGRGWSAASTKTDRRRLARSYLSSVDPLLDDAVLADELVAAAL
jgi:hypothetical protein